MSIRSHTNSLSANRDRISYHERLGGLPTTDSPKLSRTKSSHRSQLNGKSFHHTTRDREHPSLSRRNSFRQPVPNISSSPHPLLHTAQSQEKNSSLSSDSSKLSRKNSSRIVADPGGPAARTTTSSSVSRKSSFRILPEHQDTVHVSRKDSTYRPSPQLESRLSSDIGVSRISRKSSHYRSTTQTDNIQLNKEILDSHHHASHFSPDNGITCTSPNERRRKSQSQRGRRETVRGREILSIEKAYDSNEQRMKNLERMVDELTNELKRYDNGSMLNDLHPAIDSLKYEERKPPM